jgi:uncharacterized protein YndB with AHSA1/START domain
MLKKVTKSIDIKATPQKVWNVLLTDRTYRIWAGEFSEGSHFEETDWSEGSEVVFTDSSGTGLAAVVTKSVPGQEVAFRYTALYANGQTDAESPDAREMLQAHESYVLTPIDDVTTRLDVNSEMLDKWFDGMEEQWDKALAKIKVLAETAD